MAGSNAYQVWVQSANAEQIAGLDASVSRIVLALYDPSLLTNENMVQFASYCNLFVQRAESAYYLSGDNLISEAVVRKEFQRAASLLERPGAV